ncbi:MAG: adenosine deaminase [Demequinaceae bacterium]|nr:adenosine deaminase [Demequinaceae bacterium]
MTTKGCGPSAEEIHAFPKVVLHDHLDGGLRPETMLDLAQAAGHRLPTADPDALGRWFVDQASAGSLPAFLETFAHTVACLQSRDALARAAREAVVDHARDGVVYVEIRYAPELHVAGGLTMQEAVEAVAAGLDEGIAEARREGYSIRAAALLTAMRQADRSAEVAALALANPDMCVGFDIAGPEAGFPPSGHAEAFTLLRDALVPVTIHAGEAAGPDSISEAVSIGAARRLGHGLRILDDIEDPIGEPRFGKVAAFVRDNRIPLEICPTSNVQTGAASSIARHPVTVLRDLGFTVTINPDNRLMCGTTTSREMGLLVEEAGWGVADLELASLDAARAAFQPLDVRQEIAEAVFKGFEGVEP